MSGHQHLSKLEADEAVGKAILQINSGGFKEAEATLASVLTKDPRNYQALVARGTCPRAERQQQACRAAQGGGRL